jgi:hypothetical protein
MSVPVKKSRMRVGDQRELVVFGDCTGIREELGVE